MRDALASNRNKVADVGPNVDLNFSSANKNYQFHNLPIFRFLYLKISTVKSKFLMSHIRIIMLNITLLNFLKSFTILK